MKMSMSISIIDKYKQNGSLVTIVHNPANSLPYILKVQQPQQSLYPNTFQHVSYARAASSPNYLKRLATEVTEEYLKDRIAKKQEDKDKEDTYQDSLD